VVKAPNCILPRPICAVKIVVNKSLFRNFALHFSAVQGRKMNVSLSQWPPKALLEVFLFPCFFCRVHRGGQTEQRGQHIFTADRKRGQHYNHMQASCATPELAKQAMPKLRRLWKARNELSSKLSERRAMLRREGIIDHCGGASCEQDEEDEDSEDDSSELSVNTESV
jgi:hypothetical protein